VVTREDDVRAEKRVRKIGKKMKQKTKTIRRGGRIIESLLNTQIPRYYPA
jgi:hypothetical protein